MRQWASASAAGRPHAYDASAIQDMSAPQEAQFKGQDASAKVKPSEEVSPENLAKKGT